jgi:hypothetical protein
LRAQIRHLAACDTLGNPAVPTVLLQGETATGKGLIARVLHDSGPRARGPFLDVNCVAIPEALLEVELFGVTAGAFTDAKRARPGLFEAAAGGTLFLDEIDTLPLVLQGKLLTAIETKRVRRVGAVREQAVDVKAPFLVPGLCRNEAEVLQILAQDYVQRQIKRYAERVEYFRAFYQTTMEQFALQVVALCRDNELIPALGHLNVPEQIMQVEDDLEEWQGAEQYLSHWRAVEAALPHASTA